jgi:hypothetical protein
VLASGTWLATGSPWQNSLWFFSGLLAMALNRQLIEPFYPRPADTIANSIVAIFLVLVADKTVAGPGWLAAGIFFGLAGGLSLAAQLLGRASGPWSRIGRSARTLTDHATAVPIYSVVFVLALLEAFPPTDRAFWILAIAWFVLATIGVVNWERAFRADRTHGDSRVVGFVGPSLLVLESQVMPRVGTPIGIMSGGRYVNGTVVRRVRRLRHVVGEVHIDSPNDPESFLTGAVALVPAEEHHDVVGVVDHGSTDRVLRFPALRPLGVGDAVFVEATDGELLYQITQAEISRRTEQEGAELETHCRATQLGRWDDASKRIERYPWVAVPGSAILGHSARIYASLPSNQILHLGNVIGSQIPIELDLNEVSTGHVLVLGMTKMGKSTLAIRLARALAETRPVVILDQTGEYRARHGVPVCTATTFGEPGLSLKPELNSSW